MQIESDSETSNVPDMESPVCFNIVTVYQDTVAERRAKAVHDSMAGRMGGTMEFEHVTWNTVALGSSRAREVAAAQAADANLVILSLRGDGPLPIVVRDWLRQWMPHRGAGPAALAALFDTESEATGVPEILRAQLNDLARLARMDFFTTSLPRSGGQKPARRVPSRQCRIEPAFDNRAPLSVFAPAITRWAVVE
ncbi:MAG: hypothetical protein HY300_08285 [Verrucomicrobia bacterium]|nr:hypothetical protein [Verrucomicrobiota bacterium]